MGNRSGAPDEIPENAGKTNRNKDKVSGDVEETTGASDLKTKNAGMKNKASDEIPEHSGTNTSAPGKVSESSAMTSIDMDKIPKHPGKVPGNIVIASGISGYRTGSLVTTSGKIAWLVLYHDRKIKHLL